jgi:DNA mismatch repair protein MutS2
MIQTFNEPVVSEHAMLVLEFDAIRHLLSDCMSSELGHTLLPTVKPDADLDSIHYKQRQTTEAKILLTTDAPPSLRQLADPRPWLEQVALQGKVLEPPELLELQFLLLTARQTKRFFAALEERSPLLMALTQPMEFPDQLERLIVQVIDPRGEMKDDASPRLREIREELRGTRERIRRRLEGHLTQHKDVVQEPLITLRHNRYVIPLRPDFQRLVRGVVHDHSASRATVFVEPLDVLELNNRLVELTTHEDVEVHRILRQVTTAVWEVQDQVRHIAQTLAELDYILARARLSDLLDGHEPQFNAEGVIDLRQARHPLLVAQARQTAGAVVPATLAVDADTHTLVITGPNTGGKTVLLKTIGLLQLMAQTGMHIPAEAGSTLPVVQRVLVDIGDEQSIAQNLSTFSGHLQHIISFLHEADEGTLVLLDELGAGTDPAEGAALGIAVLDSLYRLGAKTFVTTHHNAIKLHAHTHADMATAVMEFDTDTLQPTFHVRMGYFGGSNAFAISRRLGMPPEVLALAESHLNADEHRLAAVTDRLQEELRALEHQRQASAHDRQAAAEARRLYEAKLAEIDKERDRELSRAADEARQLLTETQRRLEEAVHHVRRQGIAPVVEPSRQLLRQVEADIEQVTPEPASPEPHAHQLRVGEAVWLPRWRVGGVVLTAPTASDVVEVQAGQMTLKVPTAEVEPRHQGRPASKMKSSAVRHVRSPSQQDIAPEVNLIGWRVTDALPYLDKYLDDAVAAGLQRVRVIHGKGSGRLRAAIHEFLTAHPQVKSYLPGSSAEGGWGATVVELDA